MGKCTIKTEHCHIVVAACIQITPQELSLISEIVSIIPSNTNIGTGAIEITKILPGRTNIEAICKAEHDISCVAACVTDIVEATRKLINMQKDAEQAQ